MNFITENKAWLFSGIGTAIIMTIIGYALSKKGNINTQKQKSGKNSINLQSSDKITTGKLTIDRPNE